MQTSSIEIIPVNNGYLVRVPVTIPSYNVLSEKDIVVVKQMVKEMKKEQDPVMAKLQEENVDQQFANSVISNAMPLQKDDSLFIFSSFQEVINFLTERYI